MASTVETKSKTEPLVAKSKDECPSTKSSSSLNTAAGQVGNKKLEFGYDSKNIEMPSSKSSTSTSIDTFAAVAAQLSQLVANPLSSTGPSKRKFTPSRSEDNPVDRRLSHNMNNRKRLRAISDRINRLRELIESNGQRIGPRKLDILDACVQYLQADKIRKREKPAGIVYRSIYSQLFEKNDTPQIIVAISPVSANILNVSDPFCQLTGWSRAQLVSKPYSNISSQEPQSWSAQYQLLIHDVNVKALRLSNIALRSANGSKLVVNLVVKPLRLNEFSVATSLCFTIISVGNAAEKPGLQVLR